MATDSRVTELMGIGNSLFQKDWGWFQLAQDICENFYPVRADYTATADWTSNYAQYIQDGTPVLMREQLGNAIGALLRQGDWFTISSGDPAIDRIPSVARSLKAATRKMRRVIEMPGSNFKMATLEADQDWVSVGQPVMSIEENPERTQFVFKAHHPKSCTWLTDHIGRPVAMWRRLKETARNIVRKHEVGAYNGELAPEMRTAAKDEPNREFDLMHVLIPITDLYHSDYATQRKRRGPWGHKYISCMIDCAHAKYLHEGTMPVMNFIAPAYRRLSGQRRGFSPATFNALGDARMLQSMALVILEQGEKAVDPPIVAHGDIFRSEMQMFAGGMTFADLGDRDLREVMTTIQTGEGVRLGVDLKTDIRQLIAESLIINKLQLPSVREMREIEVAARLDEYRRAALPFFTPIEDEMHTQLLGLLFEMMNWRGMFPDGSFPNELRDVEETQFTFQTPLNEADGRKAVEAHFTGIQILAQAKEIDETVGNLVNVRDATVLALQGAGLAPEVIKTEEEREEADRQAKAREGLTTAAQIGQQGAGVVADLANARLAAAQAEAVGA